MRQKRVVCVANPENVQPNCLQRNFLLYYCIRRSLPLFFEQPRTNLMSYEFPTISTANSQPFTACPKTQKSRLSKATIAALVTIGLAVLLLVFAGCDSAKYERNGLELTVINQTTVSWNVKRIDTGDNWTISGDSWYEEFRCYSQGGCRSELVFKPAVRPPSNCNGWEKVTETLQIPHDYNRSEKVELDNYDLDPLPDRCESE